MATVATHESLMHEFLHGDRIASRNACRELLIRSTLPTHLQAQEGHFLTSRAEEDFTEAERHAYLAKVLHEASKPIRLKLELLCQPNSDYDPRLCNHCNGHIGDSRLTIRPESLLCVPCKLYFERERRRRLGRRH